MAPAASGRRCTSAFTMSALRLIVGLGNPGAEYAGTRHNVGFALVDALATQSGERFGMQSRLLGETARLRIGEHDVRLLRPATFMNHSGQSVAAALQYWKIEPGQCLIAHDDLDLPAGVARLKFDGGHGGQNGLRDIIAHLGHGSFHRLRIGIGHPGHKDRVTSWVLGRPSRDDAADMSIAIDAALAVMPLAVAGDMNEAMKRLHTAGTRER